MTSKITKNRYFSYFLYIFDIYFGIFVSDMDFKVLPNTNNYGFIPIYDEKIGMSEDDT